MIDLATAQTTRALGDTDFEEGMPKWGSARFNGAMNLVLTVLDTDQVFTFDADQVMELVIGRLNTDTGERPAVDLTDSDAIEKGVSRKHAVIVRRDGALHVMDYGSANGTYLNGQKLVAQQPRLLRDGDDIRLGHMVIRVTFRPQ
ncbi:MAG: FHA domain-containing protein [Anaerolineae bacterium]